MKKKTFLYILAAAAVYILLLVILALLESRYPESNIRGFGDALWYSLVTMTTVGYGDLFPVTTGGRIIGFVFLVVSVGVLATVVYSLVSFISTKVMPRMRMDLLHGKTCCIFSELNEASAALASDLLARDGNRRVIFCNIQRKETDKIPIRGKKCITTPQGAADTVHAVAGRNYKYASSVMVFLISENILSNYEEAHELEKMPVRVYCRGIETSLISNTEFFDTQDSIARLYWQTHPIRNTEKTVLIAGSGILACSILNRAVTMNCRIPFAATSYHLFGDWKNYRNYHPALCRALGSDKEKTDQDTLIFHEENWNENEDLLKAADRIIFCEDDQVRNILNAAMTGRCYGIRAQTDIAIFKEVVNEHTFGDARSLFTEEYVVRNGLDSIAREMHESYCRSVQDKDHPWQSLSPFLKDSNRAAADHILTKVRLLLPDEEPVTADKQTCQRAYEKWMAAPDKDDYRRNEHERWLRFHYLYNWRYGQTRDNQMRIHPCLTEYEDLSTEEKIKDDNAWEQIGRI